MPRPARPARLTLLLLLVVACAPASAQQFVDLVDYPADENNWDRFYALEHHLASRFDQICVDTLCEGHYSNLRALQLRCSVDRGRGRVHACTWLFIASELQVDRASGQLQVDNRHWQCPLPLGNGVPVNAFHAALETDDALHATLPGATTSVGEAVFDCLQRPVAPLPPVPGQGPYVDARDYPRPGQGHARFSVMERALVRGFDGICGDTFCEGEYANLQAMRLRCSVQATSGTVQECRWTFAGSAAGVEAATGRVVVDARQWACPMPLTEGTLLTELLTRLQGEDAIDTPLPGTRTSVYDGLTECL